MVRLAQPSLKNAVKRVSRIIRVWNRKYIQQSLSRLIDPARRNDIAWKLDCFPGGVLVQWIVNRNNGAVRIQRLCEITSTVVLPWFK